MRTDAPARTCADRHCSQEARMAVRVTRPTRADLRVTVYADDRTAPKAALVYCKEHGVAVVRDLLTTVVDADQPREAEEAEKR